MPQGIVALLIFLGLAVNAEVAPKRVLVVHSFGSGTPPFTTHSLAFETELTERVGKRVDLDEISLDMARYTDADLQEALVQYIKKRQNKWQPDLVVPIGSPAGIFVAEYRERLFPNTPILYTGMDKRRLPPGALDTNAAFVGESFDVPGLVDDMLQIAPTTTNIVMVIGASQNEQYWKAAFEHESASFTNRVGFTWLNDLPFDDILDRVSKLPPRSYIFLVLLLRDASGVSHNADESLRRIRAVANAPINSVFQHQLGMGIVGGRLYQAELEGVESARIAIRILQGESPSSFPPRIVGPLPPRYDWRELRRWNIPEKTLPPGSTILFREPTLWDRYGVWVMAGVAVCVVEALLISALVASLARRRRAERSLKESSNRLRSIFESAVDGIITFNKKGIIESTNAASEKIFGYSMAELTGQNISLLVSDSPEGNGHASFEFPADIGETVEVTGRRKDGYLFPLEVSISKVDVTDRDIFTGFVRDITERKQSEQAARDFGGRLLRAQEGERARLARELHDDVSQRLARLAIDTGQIELGKSNGDISIREVREGLVLLSEDIHALSYRLHPSMLTDLGLGAALRAECAHFSRRSSIATEVKITELPLQIPPEAALCIFRIAQEALHNVERHADSKMARVSLRHIDGGLHLAVEDNGAGFNPGSPRETQSLGLASMRERVHLVGGELEIQSSPGRGTTIFAWVPITEEIGESS